MERLFHTAIVFVLGCGCTPHVPPYKNLAESPGAKRERIAGESAEAAPSLALDQFRAIPNLTVAEHPLTAAKFPCIDVHMHPKVRLRGSVQALDDYVKVMDEQNIAVSVSLDGGLGEALDEHIQ